jgi:mannose-1-phosphate guanylyltransferase
LPGGLDFRPVILAGGSGTRFWPRSRQKHAKQVLALDGDRTMIQQTVDRISPIATLERFWVITSKVLTGVVRSQLVGIPAGQIVSEPAARNTAPAAGLAAFLIEKENPDAVLGMFSADAVVEDEAVFLAVVERAIALATAGGNLVVLGVLPTRPETGYGYIETGELLEDGAIRVRRFTEKPNLETAQQFLVAGNYFWNSGIFFWSARTLANAIREYLPETASLLEKIAAAHGTAEFDQVFAEFYPQCKNISVDFAVLEPCSAKGEHRSNLYCLPASFGWNDLGSWAALYEHQLGLSRGADDNENVTESAGSIVIDARRNYVYSPMKHVALVGVEDLVVVETDDAILVTTRARSQDVGKIVKALAEDGRKDLI